LKTSKDRAVKAAKKVIGALLIAALFVGLLCLALSNAKRYQQTYDAHKHDADDTSHQQSPNLPWWYPSDAIGLYTFLLAVFTAGLTVASVWQGYFLVRADKSARRAADAALAAANAASTQANHLASSVEEAKRAADEMAKVATAMKATAISTADSAEAAEKSAYSADRTASAMEEAAHAMGKQALLLHQTYLATHRPLLVIHSIRLLRSDETIPPDQQPVTAEFAIVNAGTGKCKMTTGSAVYLQYLEPIDKPHLPSLVRNDIIPLRPFEVGATDNSIRVSSDEWGGLNHVHAMGEARERTERLRQNPGIVTHGPWSPRKILYLHGWVVYDEDSGHTRTTYFRREYSHDAERFSPSADPDDEKTY
jgi:hypothetical protein